MFDTMTLTKIVGGLCGALLVYLMGNWVAESMYSMGGGHGDDHHAAYVIDTGEDDHGGAAEEEGPDFAAMYAMADLGKGEKVFGKCKACHKLDDGANSTGPFLHGVVGRDVGAADGFGYSGALKAVAQNWTPETLNAFLESPKGYAPGTSMAFSGLKKPADRVNLIAFLDMTDGDFTELAMAAAAEEHAADDHAAEEPAAEEAMAEEPAAEEPAAEEAADAGAASGFAALVAAADVAKGEKVYKKCKACHALQDGKNRVGPHLFNLVDRDIASVDGFKYGDALSAAEGNWTMDQLSAFLEKPKAFAPGTKMSFSGLRKENDRAAVIAYIQSAAQ